MNGNRLRFTGSGTVHCRNGTRMIWPAQSGTEGIRVQVSQASRLRNVTYDIRGPVLRRARQLEAEGHPIIKLNLGNPAPFGLHAPDDVLADVLHHLPEAQGYSDARGIQPGRVAVAESFERRGVTGVSPDDVFLGNGVSELIVMSMQALLDTGDEVLIPSPDYPLWTGAVNLCGGRAVHYLCVEEEGWQPDVEHVESLITDRTKALVIINPNNPTGAVYSREVMLGLLDLARRHGLLVLTDEIYDQILYDGAVHHSAAALAPDLLVLTLGGLSKTYRLAGFRSGWLVISGPREHAADYIDGLELLANMRLCPNVPAQYAIQTALGGKVDIKQLLEPGGRLRDQRDRAFERMTAIPGVTCVQPAGALYLFPRLDPEAYKIRDDEQMMMDFLEQQHVLLSHGSGFNLPTTDHLRLVFLAPVPVLDDAIGRLATFLADYHQ
jgi:alanine-synthesizing transaminase